jgi:DNA-binding MarR family transcriptional regulator
MSDWNFFLAKCLLREFERNELHFIGSLEDLDLVWAIGYGQQTGSPLGLKELLDGKYGAPKTVQRRLDRLRRLRIIDVRRCERDARRIELLLNPRTLKRIDRYKEFILENGMGSRDPSLIKVKEGGPAPARQRRTASHP